MPISTFVAVPSLSVGDKITASRWGTIVTALAFLLAPPEAIATNVAGTSIPNNTLTLVPMATEDVDTGTSYDGAMHDNVTNNSRVVATTAGRYLIEARIAFAANATGRRVISVRKNAAGNPAGGTQAFAVAAANPGVSDLAVCKDSVYQTLSANDYLEVFAIQASGGALTLDTAAGSNYLHLRLVGN